MQTYFTELPSPSLKHKAHKYTSKKFVNGKWQYFYDYVLTGRGQKRDAQYNKKLAERLKYEEDKARNNASTAKDPSIRKDYLREARVAHVNRVKEETQGYNQEQNYKNHTLAGKAEAAVKKVKKYIDTSVTGRYYKNKRDHYEDKAQRMGTDELKKYSSASANAANKARNYEISNLNRSIKNVNKQLSSYNMAVEDKNLWSLVSKMAPTSTYQNGYRVDFNHLLASKEAGIQAAGAHLNNAVEKYKRDASKYNDMSKNANDKITKAARVNQYDGSSAYLAKAAKANYDYETKSLAGKATRAAKKTKKFVSNTTKNIADTFREAASKAKKKKKSK